MSDRGVVDLAEFRRGLRDSGGDGTSGGMEPWQQSVESRLGELRADLRTVSADVSTIKTDVGKLSVKVDHLPSKGFVVVVVVGTGAVLGALSAFGPAIRHLLGMAS